MRRAKVWKWGSAALAALLMLFLMAPTQEALVVRFEGRILWASSVEPGTRLTLSYIHSVERTPIRDILEIRDTEEGNPVLVLLQTEQQSFGAGLPTAAEGGGIRMEDGFYVLDTKPMVLGSIPLRVGAVADHRIQLDSGADLVLLERVPPGSLVELKLGRVSRITLYRSKEVS